VLNFTLFYKTGFSITE